MEPTKFNRLFRKLNTDKNAFEQIYSEYYPLVVIHIRSCYGNLVSAEDVAQDLFFKLLNFDQQDNITHPTAWIFRLAENIAVDKIRKSNHELPLKEMVSTPLNMDTHIDDGELKIYFMGLDETTQKILYMYYWEGYSLKEISLELGIKYANLRVKVSRAYSKLKKKMQHK